MSDDTWVLTATFANERAAYYSYIEMQNEVFNADCDLSVYRFRYNGVQYVAVLGKRPDEILAERLSAYLLLNGTPAEVPAEVLTMLVERRVVVSERTARAVGHYRPGVPIDKMLTENEEDDEPCDDPACVNGSCPEHPTHDGSDHTYEQHHSRVDHVDQNGNPAPEQCRCPVYVEEDADADA